MHEIVTIIAKYFIGLSVLGTAAVWLKVTTPEKKRFIFLAVLGAVFSLAIAKLGNKLHTDPRPFVTGHFTPYFTHSADNGFPSDHTLFASFLAFTTWYFSRKAGIVLFVIAVLIGLSRVVAGVHHLQDIIGSILITALGVWLANLIINRLVRHPKTYGKEAREPQE
ncbi:MAG TPA: phosphatase PAP2 family protein [Candidatus Saccharimonadales bacterium]|nr:phosphatase PAP2 family protein [Candidatus Saccharimonadales bacterium]